MHKVDLHTHSSASPDGGISLEKYKKTLDNNQLDYIAITDHNRIDFALTAQKELGSQIIVGEEIMTDSGEVIGLYLNKVVKPNLSLKDAVREIKSQGGLVYIPHPFETARKGISEENLIDIIDEIDIIETINGRAFTDNQADRASEFATKHKLPGFASSDAHGFSGWGRTHTLLADEPNKNNLVELASESELVYKKPSIRAIFYPKYNRIKVIFSS